MFSKALIAVTLAGASLFFAAHANAQDFAPKQQGDWLLNVRASNVAPDASAPILTAAGADTGLKAEVDDSSSLSLGLAYFLTDHVAVEVIAATTKHEVRAKGPGTDVKVHETWVLPPVVSLQYHFLPAQRVSPYVGAGVNYMVFYNGEDANGFKVDLEDGFGYALEAGVDIGVSPHYSLNIDAKKVFFETDANINDGALKSTVDLDPWVLSIGIGRKF